MARKSVRALWGEKINSGSVSSPKKIKVNWVRKNSYSGIVLGIDPSLRGTGLALIEFVKGEAKRFIDSTTVNSKSNATFAQCLASIFKGVTEMMGEHTISHVALEQTIYVQNFKVAQILGAARGAAIAAASLKGAEIFEYPPLRVKQAVVGNGRASKEQVGKMVMQMLRQSDVLPLDESDAAGVAFCHAMTYGNPFN